MPDPALHQRTLRIGTRGSKLARWQANWVADRLQELGHSVEIIEIATQGDKDAASSIATFSGTGVFTKEIQRALLASEVDLAVHSLKDLPTDEVTGLILAAVPPREPPNDVLVSREHKQLNELPAGALIGTGSLRRQAQLRNLRPDLHVREVRGNVDTRLRKLEDGNFAAIVLARAGLERLGLADRITQVLSCDVMLPAVGQGALGIECRADDHSTREKLQPLNDANTHTAVIAERTLLAHLRGGCLAPVGAWARIENGSLQLSAVVLSPDGTKRVAAAGNVPANADNENAAALGCRVADSLLTQGAAALIAAARS